MTKHRFKAVVIGVSVGALEALSAILPHLPKNYSLPVMLVVHIPADKRSIMANLLQTKCKVEIKEAEDKEPALPGTVYIAPPDYHLLVEKNGCLSLSSDEPVLYSRPSIDVLFETAADAYGGALIGVILTGANSDGAQGLKIIMQNGGTALVQRPDMAHSAIMPQAALKLCPEAEILGLDQIADYMLKAAS